MKVLPKIIHTLELFGNDATLEFAEIVRLTGLSRSNTAHIVSALCANRLLEKSAYGQYRLGPRLFELTGGNRQHSQLLMLAERSASGIAGMLHELGVVVGFWRNRRITLAKVQPESMVRLNIADRWFDKSGWYCHSGGRLLLALQPDAIVDAIVSEVGPPAPEAWPEAVSEAGLRCEIARIRQQRQVVMQRENGRITSLAVPVQDAGGYDSLCVSTVYITGHRQPGDADTIVRLQEVAADFNAQLIFHQIVVNRIIPSEPTPGATES